jgi:NTP pyrophosphatase (non-canonical NTP hydrolase)
MGEVGELANLLKKVDLAAIQPGYEGPELATAMPAMHTELADVQIYMLRLAHLLGVDLTEAVLAKMGSNDERYAHLSPR